MHRFIETIKLLENSSFFYIITTGMEGTYNYVNSNYAKAFSSIHGDVIGQPYHVTMHPDDTEICKEVGEKCFRFPDRSFPATIRKHDGRGGYVITQWEYTAIIDEQKQPQGIFCMGYDITETVANADELKLANSANLRKQGILDQIGWEQSHLIRRPLANILGLINILNKMDLDQNVQSVFSMLLESTVDLDNVIRGIVVKANMN